MPTTRRTPARKLPLKKTASRGAVVRKRAAAKTPAKTAAAAPAGLPEASVKVVLRFHLKNLNTSGQAVDDGSVLGDALSDLAVAGMSARALFKALSRRDIVRNGGTDKTWPAKWPELTVQSLAPKLAG